MIKKQREGNSKLRVPNHDDVNMFSTENIPAIKIPSKKGKR